MPIWSRSLRDESVRLHAVNDVTFLLFCYYYCTVHTDNDTTV